MMQQIVIAQTHLTARPGFHRQIFGQKNSLGRSPDRWFGQRVVAAQSGSTHVDDGRRFFVSRVVVAPLMMGLVEWGAQEAPARGEFDLSLLSGTPTSGPPKGYVKVVKELTSSLRASIELENEGASELKVRAKADGAKEPIQKFLKEWKDRPEVMSEPSYEAVLSVLRTLGNFYREKGQRAALPKDVTESILKDLAVAEASLDFS
eukprot:CAMPEP_0114297708 /NCGR_PEP_ID=MMETSP0059-20121206/12002_1 /TAXON_ID=36894 /ORGANISM="Pyramimonas parkeae, Strain CCMP726" /LENGTH=204 /DNA_ID=CAMNT_0001419967 /DNA_START=53 /DNA_END=667 /DNA_ORIENTATION=-